MPLIDITPPGAEPVTAAEVKAAAKIDGSEFDAQIAIIIPALRGLAEQKLGRRLITQTCELVMDTFPCHGEICLQVPDVSTLSSIKYLDYTTGLEVTLASTEYVFDGNSTPCRIVPAYGKYWPPTYRTVNAVRVRFICGFGAASTNVPQDIRHWILAYAAQALNNPSGLTLDNLAPLPFVDHLLDRHMVLGCC